MRMPKKILTATALGLIALAGVSRANAAEPFRCEPGELYVMNVMVSGVEYWFPVYEVFKQAGEQMGCETIFTGTPDYDITKQIASLRPGSGAEPKGILVHPMNADPVHRADQPRHRAGRRRSSPSRRTRRTRSAPRYITSDNDREGKFAAEEIAEAMGGKGEYAVLENPGPGQPRPAHHRLHRLHGSELPGHEAGRPPASNQDPNKAYQARAVAWCRPTRTSARSSCRRPTRRTARRRRASNSAARSR